MTPFRYLLATIIVPCVFPGRIDAATDAEKALATRCVTLLAHGIQQAEGGDRGRWMQEPLLMGAIAYYYFRDSDREFAELLRGLAQGLLAKGDSSLDAEFPKFRANFTESTTEEVAMTRLHFFGFDDSTSRRLLDDARQDGLKEFESWFRENPNNNK